jgi:hypothetical protein
MNSDATLGSHLTQALIPRAAAFFVFTLNRTSFQLMLHRRVLGHINPKISPQLYILQLYLTIDENKGCFSLWPCHLHLKKYLNANFFYGESNISPCKNIILKKSS